MVRDQKGALYIKLIETLATKLGKNAGSILEAASADLSILELFPDASRRISVDRRKPADLDGVEAHALNLMDFKDPEKFDLAISTQGLQKVKSPAKAAAKLRSMARVVIVSVPYRWSEERSGKSIMHHDIDEETMLEWFGRAPNFQYVCREVDSGDERLIQVYEKNGIVWNSLKERTALRAEASAAKRNSK